MGCDLLWSLRMSPSQAEEIRQLAESRGQPLSAVLRDLLASGLRRAKKDSKNISPPA